MADRQLHMHGRKGKRRSRSMQVSSTSRSTCVECTRDFVRRFELRNRQQLAGNWRGADYGNSYAKEAGLVYARPGYKLRKGQHKGESRESNGRQAKLFLGHSACVEYIQERRERRIQQCCYGQ
eukprot:2429024-Pleurochrysis_carterae.AAC.2